MAEPASDSEDEFEEEVLLFLLLIRRARRRSRAANRQTWSKQWVMRRGTHGVHANLVHELNAEDPEGFRQYHRVDRESFNELLAMVFPLIRMRFEDIS